MDLLLRRPQEHRGPRGTQSWDPREEAGMGAGGQDPAGTLAGASGAGGRPALGLRLPDARSWKVSVQVTSVPPGLRSLVRSWHISVRMMVLVPPFPSLPVNLVLQGTC